MGGKVVCVTGASGYVASWLVKLLLERGYTVKATVRNLRKEVFPFYRFVDVRDVAHAHVMAFENPSASGRYCLVGTTLSYSETRQILHKLYPSISAPVRAIENPTHQISKKKAESLGINFMPLEVSLKDTNKNFISL